MHTPQRCRAQTLSSAKLVMGNRVATWSYSASVLYNYKLSEAHSRMALVVESFKDLKRGLIYECRITLEVILNGGRGEGADDFTVILHEKFVTFVSVVESAIIV